MFWPSPVTHVRSRSLFLSKFILAQQYATFLDMSPVHPSSTKSDRFLKTNLDPMAKSPRSGRASMEPIHLSPRSPGRSSNEALDKSPRSNFMPSSSSRQPPELKGASPRSNWQPGGASGSNWQPGGASGSNWQPGGASGSNWQPGRSSGSNWQSGGASGSNWQPGGASGSNWQPGGASGSNLQRDDRKEGSSESSPRKSPTAEQVIFGEKGTLKKRDFREPSSTWAPPSYKKVNFQSSPREEEERDSIGSGTMDLGRTTRHGAMDALMKSVYL